MSRKIISSVETLETARAKSDKFFELQIKIDNIDSTLHQMETLIGSVTSDLKVYRFFKKFVDTVEVLNFYRHLMSICENIVNSIEKAEIELIKTIRKGESEDIVTELLKDYKKHIERILKEVEEESGRERIE